MKVKVWHLCLLLIFGGCSLVNNTDKIRPTELDWTIAVPILKTNITFGELMDEFETGGFLEVDSSGLLVFRFDSVISVNNGADFNGLADFGSPVFDTLTTLELEPLFTQSITKATLKGGVFSYVAEAFMPGDYRLFIEIPELTKGGVPLRVNRTDTYSDSISDVVLLDGYEINSPSQEVTLRFRFIDDFNDTLTLPKMAKIAFQGIEFSYLQGKRMNFDFRDRIDSLFFDLLPPNVSSSVFFGDPSLSFTFFNSFGIPMQFTINEILAISNDGQSVALTGANIGSPIAIDYPPLTEVGGFRTTEISWNKENSNFVDFFNVLPDGIGFNFQATALYQPSSPSDPDIFLLDTSRLDAGLDFTIPLDVRIEEFTFSDTQSVSLDLEEIELGVGGEAEFKLFTVNAIPLVAKMQIYFLSSGGIIDSLFDGFDPILGAATVDAEGLVTEPAVNEFFFTVTNERLSNLEQSTGLIIKTAFETSHNPGETVKLLEQSNLEIKLGVKAKTTIN